MPILRDPASPQRLWRSIRWGDTAEIFVLDCRSEKKWPENYVSDAQMNWLKAGLSESTAVFKRIFNSVPIGDFPAAFDTPITAINRWQGYRSQAPNPFLSSVMRDPLFEFATGEKNYVALHLDPRLAQARVTFHWGDGSVLLNKTIGA